MFKSPIVFVIGAGAGFEYRMPLGEALASGIAKDTPFLFEGYSNRPSRGDPHLYALLQSKFSNDRDALVRFGEAGNRLSAAISSSISIDDALYQLSEFPEAVTLGKICIIVSILKAERQSTLALSPETGRLSETSGRDGWIQQMFSMAVSNMKQSELKDAFKNVTFINFNYDRCLEHYLFWSLCRLGLDENESAGIVEGLNIVRPYGTLGSILIGRKNYMAFGIGGRMDAFEVANRIRTYTESALHDKDQLQQIVLNAHQFIFLGFGFHPQNLELLAVDPGTAVRERATVLATVYGVHPANIDVLRSRLERTLRIGRFIEFHSMTTPDMLSQLRMRILN